MSREGMSRDNLSRESTVRMSRDGGSRGADRGWDDGQADRDDRSGRTGGRRSAGFDDRDSSDDLMSGKTARSTSGRGGRSDNFDNREMEDRTVRLSSSREHSRPGQDRSAPGTREREVTAASAGRDDRERRGNTGPNARPDSRKSAPSPSRADDLLPDIKPRPSKSKSKRDGDSDLDWPSNEWDELSDVDYWTELAADKPFNSADTTQALTPPVKADRDRGKSRSDTDAPTRSERREVSQRRDPAERRDSTERRDPAERRDTTERRDQRENLPPAARVSRQTVDAAFAPVTGDPAGAFGRTGSYGSTELRRAIAAGDEAPRSRSSRSASANPGPASPTPSAPVPSSPVPAGGLGSVGLGSADTGSRSVQPLDDDPLTSPSFPRIASEDSRSYRRSRSDRGTGSHAIPAASDSQPHARPTSSYPAMPPVNGLDSHSASYSQPAVNGLDYAAAPAMPPVPAVDPYRQHSVSSASDSYPGRAAASSDYGANSDYGASSGYGAGSDYAASTGNYSAPAGVGAGYLPPVGGSYPIGDSATAAYSSRSATSGGYPIQSPPSQLPPSQLPPAQLPPNSPVYPGSSGYPGDHDNGYGTAASYPAPSAPAEQPSYSGYPTAASSGQHAAPPTSEYSYPVADPGYALPPAASQPVADYSGYQPSAQADHNGYQHAAQTQGMSGSHGGFGVDPVQPGYSSAPYNAPYQQTGHPGQGYEADPNYPADPYAVDPYGYPGYGSARLPGRHHAASPAEQTPIVYERYDSRAVEPRGYDPREFATPEYAGYGQPGQPWNDQGWQDLSQDDQRWQEQPRHEQQWHELQRDERGPNGYR